MKVKDFEENEVEMTAVKEDLQRFKEMSENYMERVTLLETQLRDTTSA